MFRNILPASSVALRILPSSPPSCHSPRLLDIVRMDSPFKSSILAGKVALITGGGSGIGLEISRQLGGRCISHVEPAQGPHPHLQHALARAAGDVSWGSGSCPLCACRAAWRQGSHFWAEGEGPAGGSGGAIPRGRGHPVRAGAELRQPLCPPVISSVASCFRLKVRVHAFSKLGSAASV